MRRILLLAACLLLGSGPLSAPSRLPFVGSPDTLSREALSLRSWQGGRGVIAGDTPSGLSSFFQQVRPPHSPPKGIRPATPAPNRPLRNYRGAIMSEVTLDPAAYGEATSLFYSFKDYMDTVLYSEEWGYYSSGRVKIAHGGDFMTYPMFLSPLFGQLLAEHSLALYQGMRSAGSLSPEEPFMVVEYGGGVGEMANDFLRYVTDQAQKNPVRWGALSQQLQYVLVERSPALRQKQMERNQTFGSKFTSIAGDARHPSRSLPKQGMKGIILSNELPDAFGVHKILFTHHEAPRVALSIPRIHGEFFARISAGDRALAQLIKDESQMARAKVGLSEPHFYYLTKVSFNALLAAIYTKPEEFWELNLSLISFNEAYIPASYVPEIQSYLDRHGKDYLAGLKRDPTDAVLYVNPDADHYVTEAGDALRAGYLMTIDYGHTTRELFEVLTKYGQLLWLMPSSELGVHDNPYLLPGLFDITSKINFSSLDTAGRAAGLKTVYFGQQGHLLAGTSLESASIDVHRLRHYPHVSNTHVEAFRSGLGHFRVLLQQKVGTDPHYRFPGPPSEPLHGRATHLYHRVLDVLENRLLAKPRNDTPRARLSPFSKRELLDLEERLLDQRFLSWSVSGHSVGAYLEPAFEFDSHNVLEVIHVFPNGGAEEASAHLEHNKGGWHVRQGALGEVALDRYLLQDGRRLLVISTIQPGAGYRELRKSLRHRLDPWREETIIRIAEVGSAMGYLVAATSAEARLRTNPNMNDFEIRTNYVDPFKGAMWADTLFSFNHPAEESSDPLPLKVYQDERISTFPASKRRPGHYGISRILYRSS